MMERLTGSMIPRPGEAVLPLDGISGPDPAVSRRRRCRPRMILFYSLRAVVPAAGSFLSRSGFSRSDFLHSDFPAFDLLQS